MKYRPLAAAGLMMLVAGCSAPDLGRFSETRPAFDPVAFFTGHVTSWGVLENWDGAPTGTVTTDCHGTLDTPDDLHMVQHLTEGGDQQERDWHMRRVTPTHYEATANDIVGKAEGDVFGRVFHLRYILALKPGNALENVSMDQFMYAEDDGSMVNRATISKFGVIVAEVTEHFRHTQ